jgi:hypothetical protein
VLGVIFVVAWTIPFWLILFCRPITPPPTQCPISISASAIQFEAGRHAAHHIEIAFDTIPGRHDPFRDAVVARLRLPAGISIVEGGIGRLELLDQ